MDHPAPHWRPQPLDPGTPVAVYNRSLSSWTSGFRVATRNNGRYRLRRASDRALLPGEFTQGDLRWERQSDGLMEGTDESHV
jgi:hypothetical protein